MSGDWRRGLAAGVAAALAVFPPTAAAWWVLEADVGIVPPDDVLVEMTTQPAPPAPVTADYPSSRVAADATAMPSASVTVVSFTSAEETVAPEQEPEDGGTGGGGVRPSGDLGIPDLVLQAYQQAAERLARSHPGCGVSWHLLAGIGKVESGHASGGRVDDSGRTHRPILGPRLDGVSTAAIRDTDGGALDGDTVWDRAVGPMQFIPGTWRAYGTDATGDGVADPHNVFDAALSAGRYLCAGGGDLTTEEGRIAALLRYNRSMSYVRTVLAWAQAYESGQVRSTPALPPGPAPAGGTTTPAPGSTTPPPSPTPTSPTSPAGPTAPTSPTSPTSPTGTPSPTPTTNEPTPTPTPTETTPEGTESPNPEPEPSPSGSETTAPAEPTPTGSETTAPAEPTPTGSETTAPAEPAPTGSETTAPAESTEPSPTESEPTAP